MGLRPARVCVPLLLTLLSCLSVNAQIKGIVSDDKSGVPLPYANIQLVNKSSGTSSDEQGRFSLPDADSGSLIVVSATGYEPLQVALRRDHRFAAAQSKCTFTGSGRERQTKKQYLKDREL